MNKLYFSLSLIAAVAFGNKIVAQTTITTAASPTVGYTYNMIADTLTADMPTFTVSAPSVSAQTWDYSQSFSSAFGTSISFSATTGNPGAASFPNSNLASDQGGGKLGYLIANSNGLYIDGAYVTLQGVSAALDFNPNVPQLPAPFTIGNTTTVTYTALGTTTFSGTPVVVHHNGVRTVTADAFGTVITPAGTYSNTLRVYTHEIISDSIFVQFIPGTNTLYTEYYDTTTNYSWYQNTPDALVMSIDQNTMGATTEAQYLQNFSNAINTIKHTELATNLYPNPASTFANLTYENATAAKVSASIFDVTGRQVATLVNNQQQAAGKQTLNIDVVNLQLPQGLYMVQLTVNGATKTLKLNIQ